MKWEYAVYVVELATFLARGGQVDPQHLHAALNAYGGDGWELCSTVETNVHHGATRSLVFVFKRPVNVDRAPPVPEDDAA